jgi:tetrahydromethanopterin S-methyltransferase subunit B
VAVPERTETQKPSTPSSRLPAQHDPDRRGVSWGVFWISVALLVLAVAAVIVQTQRVQNQAEQIEALNGRVQGLEVQLSAANTQLATYDMQFDLVRTSVDSLFDQLTKLQALVNSNPLTSEPTSPGAEPGAAPASQPSAESTLPTPPAP